MTPPPGSGTGSSGEKKPEARAEKSYLASAVESMNSWTSNRSNTPTQKDGQPPPAAKPNPVPSKKADDHSLNTLYGQSFRRYPPDCPPLNVKWFHAVDVPKRKPEFIKGRKEKEEAKLTGAKKFSMFSLDDSRSLENAYQKLLEELEDDRGKGSASRRTRTSSRPSSTVLKEGKPNTSIDSENENPRHGVRVPVNEDFLFDVDIEERELAPVYWLGPIYDVRRGSWFYQEGSTLRPCEENLASQLEEGFLKVKPWTYPAIRSRSNSGAVQDITPKASKENLKSVAASPADSSFKSPSSQSQALAQHQPQTYRLFGTYMNSVATYQDSTTAWLSTDSVFSWMTSTVYQRFAGGGYMSGVKLVRGYSDWNKTKDDKRPATPTTAVLPRNEPDEKDHKALKRRSAPPLSRGDSTTSVQSEKDEVASEIERRENRLKRQFSNYIDDYSNDKRSINSWALLLHTPCPRQRACLVHSCIVIPRIYTDTCIENSDDPKKQQEQMRKREEQEIQDDYNPQAGETQGREIEHLILVTHGIGQLLGIRMESINFIHDVNMLRKTLKGVYSHSDDLRSLNSENGGGPGNCRVQVLPVCWRHLLDFPKRREKKGEHDLGTTVDEEDEYPSLEDITIEGGVAFARSIMSDLALDVLLYQSAYREQICEIVLKESNRIYKLFKQRNPEFKGKVHIMGHSLGSAIMFDILCRQKEKVSQARLLRNPLRVWPADNRSESPKDPHALDFDFDVDDLYCLGSPIGLFQMLKGRTISARHVSDAMPSESPLDPEYMEYPFTAASATERSSPITGLPFSISSPKVAQLFNIFHPADPISYRLEPLISPAMSSLKPQILPYTKKGIFDSVAPQGLSGIGVKVGQSVSGLWSSISGGIASSILNRSLGLTNEEVANFTASSNNTAASASNTPPEASPGAGTNIISGGVISDNATQSKQTEARRKGQARQQTTSSSSSSVAATPGLPKAGGSSENTRLLNNEVETLFSNFQKKRVEAVSRADEKGKALGDEWAEDQAKTAKLRREEMKVRALNRNGRVDYSIQESVLDFNPINTIASHMAYWQDEDVSHFVMSQLLSGKGKKGSDAK